MDYPHCFTFPPGTTLEGELSAAMNRIEKEGVTYPHGYYDMLVEKYRREPLLYPFTLILIGNRWIQNHFFYPTLVNHSGRFLDYGCGAGDGVRQLIRDGYPREQITAFDISWSGIHLGFDLYRDREEMSGIFVVSGTFPFGRAEVDTVYSNFVLHCIAEDEEYACYLENAYSALRPGGIFFGSTIGMVEEGGKFTVDNGLQRLTTREQLMDDLTAAGFINHAIVQHPVIPGFLSSLAKQSRASGIARGICRYLFGHSVVCNNYNRCFFDFCTQKGGIVLPEDGGFRGIGHTLAGD